MTSSSSTQRHYASISDFLIHNKSVYALPIDCNLTWVKKSDTLPIAFNKILQRRVHSLPVLRDDSITASTGVPIGFLDLIDIVYYVLSTAEQVAETGSTKSDEEILRQELFSEVPCEDVINYSRRNPYVITTGETNLQTSLQFMLESNVHRLAVLRPDGNIIGVLSQLDVMKWLKRSVGECDPLKHLFSKTPTELGLLREVVTVSHNNTAKEAFYTIRDKGISGVGVVNDRGALVGTISGFDSKVIGFNSELFGLLCLPLEKFMKHFIEPTSIIFVEPSDPLEKVVELMSSHEVHRIYLLETSKKLVGVISPIDIIKCCLEYK